YLSPCGRGRPEGAGEGYLWIVLVCKKISKKHTVQIKRMLKIVFATILENGDFRCGNLGIKNHLKSHA
ncbi:MAG: hypothetical protein Q8K37_01750, partial [Alphaproteobacteria bacterium]|nr:hypothetical protein [Alphaproteobacteria bacterium]